MANNSFTTGPICAKAKAEEHSMFDKEIKRFFCASSIENILLIISFQEILHLTLRLFLFCGNRVCGKFSMVNVDRSVCTLDRTASTFERSRSQG